VDAANHQFCTWTDQNAGRIDGHIGVWKAAPPRLHSWERPQPERNGLPFLQPVDARGLAGAGSNPAAIELNDVTALRSVSLARASVSNAASLTPSMRLAILV
jgi:hypothetical protein